MTTVTNLDAVKNHLSIADSVTTYDAFLLQTIAQVDRCIKEFTGQQLVRATYTEYYDGSGASTIRLRQRPVLSVASVYYDPDGWYGQKAGSFDSTKLLTAGTDYALRLDQSDGTSRSGLLYRVGTIWPAAVAARFGYLATEPAPSPGTVKVTYTAGYDPIPADLTLAANQIIAGVRASAKLGPGLVKSGEDFPVGMDYSYTLGNLLKMTGEFPEVGQAFSILRRYRALGMGI